MLLASLRPDAWRRRSGDLQRLVASQQLTGLADAAQFHGVAGYVHQALRNVDGVAPETAADLHRAYRSVLAGHLGALATLTTVGAVLDRAQLPWLVVKGPVLATAVHPRPDLRGYGDLDVVVPAAAFPLALEALEAVGGTVPRADWGARHRVTAGEVPVVLPDGGVVDLHWHLLNDGRLRTPFRVPMRELFTRAVDVTVGDHRLRSLDPTDTVLHLGLHTMMSGANRLVWLKDLERSLVARPPDTTELVRRAHDWHVELPVATALAKARAILGANVPEALLRALVPGGTWERVSAVVWCVSPPARALAGPSVDRIVSRATRRDAASSLRELARRAGHAVLPGRRSGPSSSSPDEAERGAFLRAVVSGPDAYSI